MTRHTLSRLILVLSGLALVALPLHAQQLERNFPATRDTIVELQNLHGQVQIHGWDRMEVRVVAQPRSDAIEIHFDRPASRIHIHTHILKNTATAEERIVDFEIWAPANIHLEAKLQTGTLNIENFSEDVNVETVTATVSLHNLSGHTSVQTLNGSVEATRCLGRLEATTISGSLRFTDCPAHYLTARTTSGDIHFVGELKFAGTYEFNSNEGLIDLLLPSLASFELSASSMKGEIVSEFPLKSRSHGRLPQRDFQHTLLGTSQSGAALVRAISFSGRIQIRKN